MTVGSLQAYNFEIKAGLDQPADRVNYIEPSSVQVGTGLQTVVTLTGSTTNNSVNLATLFPGITAANTVIIEEISAAPGKATTFSAANSGTKIPLRANGVLALTLTGSTPPTIYFDNAGAGSADLRITLFGS